ncbi:MAG: NAD-dependent protein deacetylase [Myxococcales bacterium]|nr:NAD-dependent protein deacetylase [Myxococcales bacterium]
MIDDASVAALAALVRGRPLCVLTGAGVSTASGIPDYRGPLTRQKARNPIQHRAFVDDPATRARYWARSFRGWPRFRAFSPNASHHALARLEALHPVTGLITQNVDRLHQKAGAARVLDLHGALEDVRCLGCGAHETRDAFQTRLAALNPALSIEAPALAPDGDAELSDAAVRGFAVAACEACGGVMKPDVVFFGDNVPRERVAQAYAWLDAAEVLLVVGSSLAIFSGYRFVLRARERGIAVALVNLGESRADAEVALRVEAPSEVLLPRLVEALGARVTQAR